MWVGTFAFVLRSFLVERSHGGPYYCEELLKSLYLSDMIYISEVEEEEDSKDLDRLFPGPSVLVPTSSQANSEEEIKKKSMGNEQPPP